MTECLEPMRRLVVQLGANRFEAFEDAHAGFFYRLEGSMLSAMSTGPCSDMATFRDGCLVLQEEYIPEEVRRLFPDIWYFLQTGTWQAKTSAASIWQLNKALSFLNLKARPPEAANVFLQKHLLTLPREGPLSICWLDQPPPGKVNKIHSLHIFQEGRQQLHSERGSVKLDNTTGALYLKLPESPCFTWVATNRCLKGKQMHCMILRPSRRFPEGAWHVQMPERFWEGYLLMIQFSSSKKSGGVSHFTSWPGFWYTLEMECSSRHLQCRRQDLRPGGVAALEDGTVLFVSNPESLRKSRLHIFRASYGSVVSLPATVVHLVAPKGCAEYFRTKGLGRRDLRTLHPQGRAPASIWVVRRGSRLVLLLHACDRRVALGELPNGGQLPRFWDVWLRHDPSIVQPGFRPHRLHSRGKADVPMCERVLAVVPCDVGTLVFHQRSERSLPGCWSVRIGESSEIEIQKQWQKRRWCLTDDLPDVLPGDEVYVPSPDLEFLRWQLAQEPPKLPQDQRVLPIGPGGHTEFPKGCGRGGRYKKFETAGPEPPNGGYYLEHWKTHLDM